MAEQVKAWGWTMREALDSGGRLRTAGGEYFELAKPLDVQVVYVPPAVGQPAPALKDAVNVFDSLGIKHGPIERAGLVARRAHDLLVGAGTGRLDIS